MKSNNRFDGRKQRNVSSVICLLLLMVAVIPVYSADRVLVVTTDWGTTGFLSTLHTTPPWNADNDLVTINSDAVVRAHDGLIYVVNRFGADNIQVVDPDDGFDTIQQFSVGPGMNPQDIAVVSSNRAYVSLHNSNDLLIVNPQTGVTLDTISLEDFADEDGLCEMSRMLIEGGYLYVQIQRMYRQDWPDPWVPSPPSYLAVVDLATDELVDVDPLREGMQGIELAGLNPIAPMQIDWNTGDLFVPEAGEYAVIDAAGIERIDLQTWESKGMVVTEAELGGDLIDFALWSAGRGYAVVSDADFNTKLLSFDPTGGAPEVLYSPGGYVLGDVLAHPSGYLFMVDRDYSTPGVRIYDAESGDFVAGPIDTGLPPFEFVVLPDGLSNVDDVSIAEVLGSPFPNPAHDVVRLHWSSTAISPVLLEVFDLEGRLIDYRDLNGSPLPGGLEWRCMDDRGKQVASGVYLIRVTGRNGDWASRVVHILR